jgi:hypothetical protein
LKKERLNLVEKNDELIDDLEEQRRLNENLRRGLAASNLTSRNERKAPPPPKQPRRENEESTCSQEVLMTLEQQPLIPFTPLSPISARWSRVSYASSSARYMQRPVSYATAPLFVTSPPPRNLTEAPLEGSLVKRTEPTERSEKDEGEARDEERERPETSWRRPHEDGSMAHILYGDG